MSRQVFVTGMLRSGTTLTQVLLTNHPQVVEAGVCGVPDCGE